VRIAKLRPNDYSDYWTVVRIASAPVCTSSCLAVVCLTAAARAELENDGNWMKQRANSRGSRKRKENRNGNRLG
jgi:hypothetical protein